jgi:uncharacterized protein YoaH (UPF0181 family)
MEDLTKKERQKKVEEWSKLVLDLSNFPLAGLVLSILSTLPEEQQEAIKKMHKDIFETSKDNELVFKKKD